MFVCWIFWPYCVPRAPVREFFAPSPFRRGQRSRCKWNQAHPFPGCHCSVDLFGTGRKRKIQNENICLQWTSNPHHTSPRQESQRLRPLGHEGLMVISGLMSNRIMGYTYVTTRVKLIIVTCVFELNVILNFHFLSQCIF